jgi:hypothetical protein
MKRCILVAQGGIDLGIRMSDPSLNLNYASTALGVLNSPSALFYIYIINSFFVIISILKSGISDNLLASASRARNFL